MKRHPLTEENKQHLRRVGIAAPPDFLDIDESEYIEHKLVWLDTLKDASAEEIHQRVLAHAAWKDQHALGGFAPLPVPAPPAASILPFIPQDQPGKPQLVIPPAKPVSHKLEARIIIALLGLLVLLLAFSGRAHAQFSHISTIGTTNGGATLGFHASPFVIDCSTNVVCTDDGFTFHITASSTASTAFSSLTAGTNSNAGTFAVSGNTWDFSASAAFKLRVAAGLTTSANGDCGYDSTAKAWHCWQNGHDYLMIASTNVGTLGQAFLSGGDGSGTFADPVVSGPNAPGVASTANPVQVAGNDGSVVRAIKTDSAGVTQTHESGTAAVSAASLPLPSGASTAAKQPALGTAGSAAADVITIQGIASMTKLLVTPDSVALPSNQSVNVSQVAGTTTDTNSGSKSAGTLRVVLATDQPALTNKLLVTPDSVALPANQSVNVSQMNGVAPSMGNGVSGTGVQRVAVASDNTPFETIPVTTATTTDALSEAAVLSAASTNATSVKGSAGNMYGYEFFNTTTTIYYVRLYNLATAPTCSSATGFLRSIPVPPASAAGGEGGVVSNFSFPVGYTTGIAYCITGGSASTDNTNAAVGVFGAIRYK